MKRLYQFRIRSLAILIAFVALVLATWGWTSTTGISQLRERYFDDLEQNIASYLESAKIDMTIKEVLDEIDTSGYYQNPRSPFPFVIRVETNHSWRSGQPLQGGPGTTQTHLWFYGYISDPL